jgi:hypothetical protein
MFENWLRLDLGVEQRFSNVEHPWENGKQSREIIPNYLRASPFTPEARRPSDKNVGQSCFTRGIYYEPHSSL